jgi:hypothetical protein
MTLRKMAWSMTLRLWTSILPLTTTKTIDLKMKVIDHQCRW